MYIHSAFLGILLDFLDAENIDGSELRAEITHYQAQDRVTLSIWINLLERIAVLCPLPALGLRIGEHIKSAHAGVIGYLGHSCATIGDAIHLFERYARLIYDANAMSLTLEQDICTLSWGSERGAPGQLADETAIAAFFTMVQKLTNKPLYPSKVNFINAPATDTTPYERFFHCPVSFGGIQTFVAFPVDYLQTPIHSHDSNLLSLLQTHAQTLLTTLPSDSFETTLRSVLKHMLIQQIDISIVSAAFTMNMSSRTFQRRLNNHQLHFHRLLDEIKLTVFKQYLLENHYTLLDIAQRLGYADQSALTRAVKRWTGLTPTALKATRHEKQ